VDEVSCYVSVSKTSGPKGSTNNQGLESIALQGRERYALI